MQISPEQRVLNLERAAAERARMPLYQLRVARKLSQTQLAAALGTKQAAISKMERRGDVCVSTLRRYIEAMGGTLIIRAHFDDEEFEIDQFHPNGIEGEGNSEKFRTENLRQ